MKTKLIPATFAPDAAARAASAPLASSHVGPLLRDDAETAGAGLAPPARARETAATGVPGAAGMAPLVAIIGCDGAGKSTLAADLQRSLADRYPVETRYLGLGTGDLGNRIRQWPLVGGAVERALAKKASQTRSKDQRIPGLLTALVVFGFSVLRRRRFRRVLALRRNGVTVVTDRYPQIEVAGFYDGPGLSAARAGSRAVAWLAERERRMYERMARHRPSLVIRLNIDAATAWSRKPDHTIDLLQKKVAVTPLLSFGGARIVDLDARAPYEEVRRQALRSVEEVIGRTERKVLTAT